MPIKSVKTIHIAIDARMYGVAQRGIGRYLMKLIEQLEIVDKKNQYTIFLRSQNFGEYQPRNPNFKKVLWDAPWYGIKEQVTRYTLHAIRYTLYHFPHWNVPLFFNRPFVVTIHDLELFSSNRTRENTTRGHFIYWLKFQAFKIIFRHAVRASRAIIVPSNVVKEQLLDMYPQTRKKVYVIYEAPTIDKRTAYSVQRTDEFPTQSKRSTLDARRYILYVGAAYPHKNLPRLLEAWAIVHQELPEYKLVLVGKEDWFWNKIKQEWNTPTPPNLPSGRGGNDSISPPWRGGVRGGMVFYGPATDEELATLYKNAALLVQPSLEEGFSLPPLEALAHGCPVAVSDIPVHREILGEAPFYFKPTDATAMGKILKQALQNEAERALKLQNAAAALSRYSWTNHAAQTHAVYENSAGV